MKFSLLTILYFLFLLSFQNLHGQLIDEEAIEIASDKMKIQIIPAMPINAWAYDNDGELQLSGLSLWLSGSVNRENEEDYLFYVNSEIFHAQNNGYATGPLNDSLQSTDELRQQWNQLFSVTREEIEMHIQDFEDEGVINDQISDNILYYPAKGNLFFIEKYGFELPDRPGSLLATFIDRNNNGIYEPYLGDFPKIKGTQAWFSLTNTNNDRNFGYSPTHTFEIHTMMYLDNKGACATSFHYDTKIYYVGDELIDDFRVGLWMKDYFQTKYTLENCEENNYVGFIPSEGLSFFYGESDESCEDPSTTATHGRILYQKVGHKEFSYARQSKSCYTTIEEPDYSRWVYNLMRGKFTDGIVTTFGNYGYNLGSLDTIKIMYNHDDNPEYGKWYDSDKEVQCNLNTNMGGEPLRKSVLTSFGPFEMTKGTILSTEATIYYFPAIDWMTPSKERVMNQYNLIQGGCTDTLEWNPITFATEDILLYPIPASDDLYVYLDESKTVEIEILSAMAEVLISIGEVEIKSGVPYKIDVSALSPGNYFIKFKYSNMEVVVKSIIVI